MHMLNVEVEAGRNKSLSNLANGRLRGTELQAVSNSSLEICNLFGVIK